MIRSRGTTTLLSRPTHLLRGLQAMPAYFMKEEPSRRLDFNTLSDMQQKACQRYGDAPFLGYKPVPGGKYQWLSFKSFGQSVDICRAAMHHRGIRPGDKVAVLSSNRVEWAIGAYATYSLGAAYVPMYEQQQTKDINYILRDSQAKLLLVSKPGLYDKASQLVGHVPSLQDVWCFDMDWALRMKAVSPAMMVDPHDVKPDDLATIIYTSGTTGTPKGVELSHANLVENIKGMNKVIDPDETDVARSLSFLPWAHCIGMNCELNNLLQRGGQVALAGDITTVAENIKEIQPNVLFAVPTVYKKIYEKMWAKIESQGPLQRGLVELALNVAGRRRQAMQHNLPVSPLLELQFGILDKIILSKLREPLGGKLQYSPVGGSAMNVEVANFFENLGIGILEGYGLTETSPLLAINPTQIQSRVLGTVGQPVLGAEVAVVRDGERVRAGDEGEIWASGPMVFKSYHGKPKETQEAFGEMEGKRWFRTGDLGKMMEGGLLKVTGRVKELYKLENGKYVAPAVVEKALLENDLFTQVMVYGDNRPFNICVVVPNWDKLRTYAEEHHIAGLGHQSTEQQLKANPDIQAFVGENIMVACRDKVKKYEIPKRWILATEAFTVDNDMLTPKMSVKRHNVLKMYKHEINEVYAEALALQRQRQDMAGSDHHPELLHA